MNDSSTYASAAWLRPCVTGHRSIQSLDGIWTFAPDSNGDDRWRHGIEGGTWVAVPGAWNEQVLDAEWNFDACWYQTDFYCSRPKGPERIVLRFDAVALQARIWLNGTLIGDRDGGFLPFGFDITEVLNSEGGNRLVVRVEHGLSLVRTPVGSAGDRGAFQTYPPTSYDFFPFGGIIRPVRLLRIPEQHLIDVSVTPLSIAPLGCVQVQLKASSGFTGYADVRLTDRDVSCRIAMSDGMGAGELTWPEPRVWDTSDPHLEQLKVKLLDTHERVVDSYNTSFGLRLVDIKDNTLLLNGEPIQLRGFGRHEDFPVLGRSSNVAVIVRDTELMKWAGANSFRTSHYPYSEEALEHADRAGMLVISETSGVGLNFWDDDAVIQSRLVYLRRELAELVQRDRNHPSVIAWSVANEPRLIAPGSLESPPVGRLTAARATLSTLINDAKTLDPTRPAMVVGAQDHPDELLDIGDIVALNYYFGWYTQLGDICAARKILSERLADLFEMHGKPFFIAEFGADAWLGERSVNPEMWTEDYQADLIDAYLDIIEELPFMIGAHVWNFADFRTGQGVTRPGGINRKGIFSRDRRPKLAAARLRKRWVK